MKSLSADSYSPDNGKTSAFPVLRYFWKRCDWFNNSSALFIELPVLLAYGSAWKHSIRSDFHFGSASQPLDNGFYLQGDFDPCFEQKWIVPKLLQPFFQRLHTNTMSMISLREHFHWRKEGSITSSLRSRIWINTVQAIVVPLNCSGNKARSINAFSLFCKPGHIWNRRVSTKTDPTFAVPSDREFVPLHAHAPPRFWKQQVVLDNGFLRRLFDFKIQLADKSGCAHHAQGILSLKRSSGCRLPWLICWPKSSCPLKKSLIFPCRSIAMALIVKSRAFSSRPAGCAHTRLFRSAEFFILRFCPESCYFVSLPLM